jgi:ferritin-like metal-binding protein YciE
MHYEIATYGTLQQFPGTYGLNDVVKIFTQTLEEEKNASVILTKVALSVTNLKAAQKD